MDLFKSLLFVTLTVLVTAGLLVNASAAVESDAGECVRVCVLSCVHMSHM